MFARSTLIVALVLSTSACASGPQPLTLVETKSTVQLLRNEAWYRLPELMVKGDSDTTDVSVACAEDTSGRLRYWSSSTIALLNNSFAPRAIGVADELAESFAQQGWTAKRSEADTSVRTVLTSPKSVAVIEIAADTKTSHHRASVRITTRGPCVETAGAGSDEVRALEGN
jgi:hypothetical protein